MGLQYCHLLDVVDSYSVRIATHPDVPSLPISSIMSFLSDIIIKADDQVFYSFWDLTTFTKSGWMPPCSMKYAI